MYTALGYDFHISSLTEILRVYILLMNIADRELLPRVTNEAEEYGGSRVKITNNNLEFGGETEFYERDFNTINW